MNRNVVRITVVENNVARPAMCCPNKATRDDSMRWALMMWDKNTVQWYGKKV